MDDQGPGDGEGNVVDMKAARGARSGARAKASGGSGKMNRKDIDAHFVDAMTIQCGGGPPFERVYKVLEDAETVRRPIEVAPNGVVRLVNELGVRDTILRHSLVTLATFPADYKLEPNDAKRIYEMWRCAETPIDADAIAAVRQLSEPGLCWHRLPWDFDEAGAPTPTFDEMMGRTDNAEALMAWIGSLFIESDRQQYAYLHGEGRNGKGRLAAFLGKVFKGAFRSEYISGGRPNNFWTSGLIGARLVCFPDFESPDFCNSGFFKMLTGDDAVRVEKKGQQSFTADLVCKILILGNVPPALDESIANRRRAIYCQMAPFEGRPETVARYEAKLWAEGAAWLGQCVTRFKALDGTPIEVAERSLTEIIDAHEDPFIDIVERCFDIGSGLETCPSAMQEIFRREYMRDPRAQRRFLAFLERRYGVKKVQGVDREANASGRRRKYRGLAVNEVTTKAIQKGP